MAHRQTPTGALGNPARWTLIASERSASSWRSAAAVLLAAALVYISFSASTEAKSALRGARRGPGRDATRSTGEVVDGSVKHDGAELQFEIADRDDPGETLPVSYTGTSPTPSARAAR